MANVLYDAGREGILDESIAMNSGAVYVVLVKSAYTFSAAHVDTADLGVHENGRSAALSGKTFTGGVFDAADTTLDAIDADACEAIVLIAAPGSGLPERLVAYIDTPTSGLPFTPAAGQTVPIVWDNGANKVFKL